MFIAGNWLFVGKEGDIVNPPAKAPSKDEKQEDATTVQSLVNQFNITLHRDLGTESGYVCIVQWLPVLQLPRMLSFVETFVAGYRDMIYFVPPSRFVIFVKIS